MRGGGSRKKYAEGGRGKNMRGGGGRGKNMQGGSTKKIKYVRGVGEKNKICEGGPQNFPFRPPIRILNGISHHFLLTVCFKILFRYLIVDYSIISMCKIKIS